MTLSAILKELKIEYGYTYQQMSDLCGVSKNRIGSIVRGDVRVFLPELVAICNRCFEVHSSDVTKLIAEEKDAMTFPKGASAQYTHKMSNGQSIRITVEDIM